MTAGSRVAQSDPRWPRIASALADLRERHRHSVRIVDADCACGTLLIEAARYARVLGFTAIEGHGIDGAPTMIGRACAAATRLHEPAIGLTFGLTFELADMAQALAREADFPADIVLCHDRHGEGDQPGIVGLLAAAGDLVIGDPVSAVTRRQAA
ncbi:SAM-dependent methyltransferase [Sphingomonas aerolata]|uniref:SAM-dependent methyltransferase n=1 Tax=Sphingomonas aerolata TaxID=185951 RepID=UPI002FE262FD